jgi:hypothetical protein
LSQFLLQVQVVGSIRGVTSDFDGRYALTYNSAIDSLSVSYIGFETKAKLVNPGQNQVIDFQLDEDVISLEDVVPFEFL